MDIVYMLDRSGSMARVWSDVMSGLNQYISDQRSVSKTDRFTLIGFDNHYEVFCDRYKLGDIEEITDEDMKPRGATALYDAIGRTIEKFKGKKKVMICIMTDGMENTSQEYRKKDVKKLIEDAQGWGWKIEFAGVGIDASQDYGDLGFKNIRSFGKDRQGTEAMNTSYSVSTMSYRSE